MSDKIIWNGYELVDGDDNIQDPCAICELQDMCDRLADDLNKIEYQLCNQIVSEGYSKIHKHTYFKKYGGEN